MEETQNQSLLEVVMNRYNNLKDQKIYSRLFYSGEKLNSKSVQSFHENVFNKTGHKFDQFYGILYESDEFFIHILDGTSKCILDFLRALAKEVGKEVDNVKILFYMDDFGTVGFPRWTCRSLPAEFIKTDDETIMLSKMNESEQEMFFIKKIHFTMHQLIKIGKRISDLGPTQMNLELGTLPQNAPELIPTHESLALLAKNSFSPTLQEFIELYDTPVDVELEEELVWPAPTTFKYSTLFKENK